MRRLFLGLCLVVSLASCGAERVWAPDEAVAKAHYVDPGPTALTLITVVSNRNGTGGHSALMVSGSERVIFDPAGTWWNPGAPERNDVHYGITPRMLEIYIDYHTRITWHTVTQTILVSPQVAELALRSVEAYGAVPKAMCSNSVSEVLKELPGFTSVRNTWSPIKLMNEFAKLPGVESQTYYDDDPDNNTTKLEPALLAQAGN